MSNEKSTFDKVLERLPYSDGTGRRRFVSGGILLIGISIINWSSIGRYLGDADLMDLAASPVIVIGAVLMVYAIGSIVELLGEFFLVRSASGVVWAFGLPRRVVSKEPSPSGKFFLGLGAILAAPILAIKYICMGLVGRTKYSIEIGRDLSSEALATRKMFPAKIISGLSNPVGDDVDIALKYMIEMLESEYNRKWAWKLVNRTKDVSAITTSLFLVLALGFLSGGGGPWSPPAQSQELATFEQERASFMEQMDQVGENINSREARAEFNFIKRRIDSSSVHVVFDWLLDLRYATDWIIAAEDEYWYERFYGSSNSDENIRDDEIDAEIQTNVNRLLLLLNSLLISSDNLMDTALAARDVILRQEALATARTFALMAPFLFLYIGFFTSLRNAIVSILEQVAIERVNSVRKAHISEPVLESGIGNIPNDVY